MPKMLQNGLIHFHFYHHFGGCDTMWAIDQIEITLTTSV